MKLRSFARKTLAAAAALGAFAIGEAGAVYLNPEGLGQALIYPYYTVRIANGNPFNTFVSVVNHHTSTKALRVRFREGRNGREVGGFNLFLSPYDTWTGALVATADGAKVITTDNSCTNPLFAAAGATRELVFSSAAYSGANADGMGEGGDRTREGYVEVIEMATLIGADAAPVTHTSSGTPENCAAAQNASFAPDPAPPQGGMSGSATLINVASGMDFTYNAEALTELSDAQFYRNYTDPYPDWNAAEITRVSYFSSEGKLYRMSWASGTDAVSSVMLRSSLENEFILDAATRSETDWIVTFPTKRLYVTPSSYNPPFTAVAQQNVGCELLTLSAHSREEQVQPLVSAGAGSSVAHSACWAANVVEMRSSSSRQVSSSNTIAAVPPAFTTGWITLAFAASSSQTTGLRSLQNSWSRNLDGTQFEPGIYVLRGLPALGFMMRTFENGTLSCAASACQGNYGGAFPHRVRRAVSRAP